MNKPRDLPLAALSQQQDHSRSMTSELGREINSPLASALERVTSLKLSGKIRRNSLVALREEIEQALRAGTAAQQLCELITDTPQPRPHALDLKAALSGVLELLGASEPAGDPDVQGQTRPVLVSADPRLTRRLLTALAQWAMCRGEGPARWSVETARGVGVSRVVCSLRLREPAQGEEGFLTIDWRLVEALSTALGTRLLRRVDDGLTTVLIEFSRVSEVQSVEGLLVEELDTDEAMALYSLAMAGVSPSLLIVAGRRETRELIEQAVKPLGLACRLASTVEQARELCDAELPQAIVHEPRVRGVPFEPLRIQLLSQTPHLTTVELFEEDGADSVLQEIRPRLRMRREAAARDLSPLLMNEFSRSLRP